MIDRTIDVLRRIRARVSRSSCIELRRRRHIGSRVIESDRWLGKSREFSISRLMLFGAVWVWGDTRWILRLGPPLVVATARSWYSAPRRPVMAWVMSQGTTLPTEGKAASRHLHQDFDVNARLCIYRYGDAARTHARYIHIRTYIYHYASIRHTWHIHTHTCS